MPQGPFQTQVLSTANHSALNITAETVVKSTNGFVVRVSINTAGSAPCAIYDAATIGTAVAANLIAEIPATVGSYAVEFPFAHGLVVAPGAGGQVVSVAFN